MKNKTVEVFYAFDENFAKYAIVSISSMIKTASRERNYNVHILHTGISEATKTSVAALCRPGFEIGFSDVSEYLERIAEMLPLRDYYTKTTYFRLFIADMFPELERAIYVDADTVVLSDIAELFDTDIGDNVIGACHDQAIEQIAIFGRYPEEVLGISRHRYFNAGLLLIDCVAWRSWRVLEKFITMLGEYDFIVTQDQDYLNVICKDHVYYLDQRWNTEVTDGLSYSYDVRSEANIVHFIMANKPWKNETAAYADVFWSAARETGVFVTLRDELSRYTPTDLERDRKSGERLVRTVEAEIAREDNFIKRRRAMLAPDRREILKRIEEREAMGEFDLDVEDDPPTKPLHPDDIDYLRTSVSAKIKTYVSYLKAKKFLSYIEREGLMVVKEIRGLENLKNLDTGAILTANHFNPFDTFAIHRAFLDSGITNRKLYRVIREGNYTSSEGFYGYLMRHFYTLPLASDPATARKFVKATDKLLLDGNLVLIYPEQSMWWNYRKPKPLKPGAYRFAVKNRLPVLPIFITMRDSDRIGPDGYPIQEYTIHISEPLYPNEALGYKDAIEDMMTRNFAVWREIYEREYSMPLEYTTVKKEDAKRKEA